MLSAIDKYGTVSPEHWYQADGTDTIQLLDYLSGPTRLDRHQRYLLFDSFEALGPCGREVVASLHFLAVKHPRYF